MLGDVTFNDGGRVIQCRVGRVSAINIIYNQHLDWWLNSNAAAHTATNHSMLSCEIHYQNHFRPYVV